MLSGVNKQLKHLFSVSITLARYSWKIAVRITDIAKMDIVLKSERFVFSLVIITSSVYAVEKTSCQGRPTDIASTISPCKGILFRPICLLCNISKLTEDIIWFVDDKMLAFKGYNIDDARNGSVAVNGCPEHEEYSLKLEKPTTQNHNSVYYCQHKKENISAFALSLHIDTVLSINTSLPSNENLVLQDKNLTIELQCVITSAIPPVSLTWSLNNISKGEIMFNASSKEPTSYSYTERFDNLKTDDTVMCSSKGEYIEKNYAWLNIYVLNDEEGSGEDGNGQSENHSPTSMQKDEGKHLTYSNKLYIGLLAGLIAMSLLFSAFVIFRRYNKKSSFSIEDTTGPNVSARNVGSGGSTYEPYSQVGGTVEALAGVGPNIVSTMNLVSIVKSCGIYEYWIGTYCSDGLKEEKCFAKSLSGQATLQEASQFQDLAKRMKGLKESTSVVRVLGINIEENPFSIVYDLIEYGSLRDFVMSRYQQPPTSTPEREEGDLNTQIQELLTFASNVANAMVFVQSQNFRHPVLSLKKVLLTAQCCCKLYDIYPSDMSMKKIEEVRKKSHPPIAWMSPETIFLRRYDQSSDIWGFSTMLWELFSLGAIPYAGKQEKEIEGCIRGGVRLKQPPNCPGALYGTMLLAWDKQTANRPSFKVMLENLQGTIKSMKQEERMEAAQYFTLEAHQTNDYI